MPAVTPELRRLAELLGKGEGSPIEHKDFEFKLDDISEDGQFEGYASVFGNVDSYGDVVEPGAFKKTIRESKGQVPILWQHDPYEPIGISLELEEDVKGLHALGQLVLDVRRGAEARALMKAKAITGLSIGYQTIKWIGDETDALVDRRLKELKLWEFSPVTFPANQLAQVGNVKSVELRRLAGLLQELRDVDPELVKALLSTEPEASTRDDGAAEQQKRSEAITSMKATLGEFIDFVKNGG
jgi:HK97 family phage prohead protease